ncbi:phosphatidylglycerophosphatase A family protein [Pseudomarimonas salicorniae]|uniref:Phosphatidylglycerophosphatase A n=1 Tax=Pseudomarimonas salicorniae TaxID=2933270 RepID=A0ABT0GKP5_9GAMM|nr:phosphatidylglycerophosphatase A [Lysobacter sp. CAU 1642]MCK7594612.1 phosphatidylglycerophosphatase A [Lysobacter sp. CAU 1642]
MSRPPAWHWQVLLASGLGSGLAPRAPGTFGSLAALLPWWLLRPLPAWAYLAVTVLVFVLGVWVSERLTRQPGSEDPGWIVIDEWVGLWLALFLLPQGWPWVLAGFVLFRLFDIAKPWPVGWADRSLGGGLGVMADDALAGLMALGCLQLVALWLA